MNIALLTAASSGTRMGQDIHKQFMNIDDCLVIILTIQASQAGLQNESKYSEKQSVLETVNGTLMNFINYLK